MATRNAYQRVLKAREKDRPTGLSYISNIFDNFIELHGDRKFGDDKAIISGVARLDGMPVTVIAIEKGQDTQSKIERNFGNAYPEGYRKAVRQMKLAEKFGRPIVCFVDTSGAACQKEAEMRGQGQALAESLMEMSAIKSPIVSIIIGEGGSGGALALAVADQVWMLENAYYSVISPEGCASILWKDASMNEQAAKSLKLTAQDLYKLKVIEKIIDEPEEYVDFTKVYSNIKENLIKFFKKAKSEKFEDIVQKRYERYRKL